MKSSYCFALICALAMIGPASIPTAASGIAAAEIAPAESWSGPGNLTVGKYSERTLVVGLQIDRDEVELVAYTLKQREFIQPTAPSVSTRAFDDGGSVQAEVVLHGQDGRRYTRRVDAGPLCLVHPGDAPAHIEGDTIIVHRDAFLVELPEIDGFDSVELAYYETERAQLTRRSLGTQFLGADRYSAAAGPFGYSDLLFASESGGDEPAPQAADLLFPEDFGDIQRYRLVGNGFEVDKRINVVLIPDGYTHAEKSVMDAHADAMIAEFRSMTPYKEHDRFINYTLVYAYSVESGTDQCDCSIDRNTAMATGFPLQNPSCGHSDNRCLYYTGDCNPSAVGNIIQAELRAPAHDTTIVMVNTTRYGGCGGARAVYSAANGAATVVGTHELGHSLGGLADEYVSNDSCGTNGGEVNTSTDSVNGAWPEWIAELGAPREGARYYSECVYRPIDSCAMRSNGPPFCPVCNQHFSLGFFQNGRVASAAPIESFSPGQNVNIQPGEQVDFSIATRFSTDPAVTNSIVWTIDGPGFPGPTEVATDTENYSYLFALEGSYAVHVTAIADTNFIKPERYGANVEDAGWFVTVAQIFPPDEISDPGATPLRFTDKTTIWWEEASGIGADSYNLYRGEVTLLSSGNYGDCLESDLGPLPFTTDTEVPTPNMTWTYLIAGVNQGGEGSLGDDSSGTPRSPGTTCP